MRQRWLAVLLCALVGWISPLVARADGDAQERPQAEAKQELKKEKQKAKHHQGKKHRKVAKRGKASRKQQAGHKRRGELARSSKDRVQRGHRMARLAQQHAWQSPRSMWMGSHRGPHALHGQHRRGPAHHTLAHRGMHGFGRHSMSGFQRPNSRHEHTRGSGSGYGSSSAKFYAQRFATHQHRGPSHPMWGMHGMRSSGFGHDHRGPHGFAQQRGPTMGFHNAGWQRGMHGPAWHGRGPQGPSRHHEKNSDKDQSHKEEDGPRRGGRSRSENSRGEPAEHRRGDRSN